MTKQPDAEGEQADLAHADIGIVCALPIELGSFLDRCEKSRKYIANRFTFRGGRYRGARIAVVESGMGFARAREATLQMVEAHTPNWLLSCGFSGALSADAAIGDIVIATSIRDMHGQELKIDVGMPADRHRHVGRTLVTDDVVRKVDDKKALAEQFDAIAVDMESLAVAQVGVETSTRFMSVRAISDDLSEDLPPEILSIIGSTGSMRVGAALGALWKRPSSAKDMWRLRENAMKAADSLAEFLDGVVEQLCPS